VKLTGALCVVLATALSGCGGIGPASTGGISDAATADTQASEGNTCNVLVQSQPNGGHLHTANNCDPVSYASNPPSSGTHYPDWAMYQTYAAPVPWGFLVHNLEHGGIILVYNCPTGCPAEVAQAQAFIDGLAPDGACRGARMKIVMAPDPTLDVRWAASAWTWTLRADCLDTSALASFVAAYYDGPDTEAACGGDLDRSAAGWCP
jgi:hypothetical protein